MLHLKHFSLAEARRMLPELKIKLSKIVELKRTLDESGYDIYKHQYFSGTGRNGTGAFPKELEALIQLLSKISEAGILVKGIDNGLVDFPHVRENGEEVYLCFMLGEDDIEFWHSIEDGFSGRKPVEDL